MVEEGEECDLGTQNGSSSSACHEDCVLNVCGDGISVSSETCDDAGESATCDDDCTAASCGDGTVNMTAGEECDGTPDCNADCTLM
jgi:hypothetical protein